MLHTNTQTPFRLLCLLAVAAVLAGCAGGRLTGKSDPRVKFEPLEPRVDIVTGHTLVMPVKINGPIPSVGPKARLDDGRYIDTGLYWIGYSTTKRDQALYDWLAPSGIWSATPFASDRLPPSVGAWFIVVDLPLDAIGQDLWIERGHIKLNWVQSPALALAEHPDIPLGSPLDADLLASPYLRRMVEPSSRNPMTRWRFRLLTKGFEPKPFAIARADADEPPAPDAFLDEVLEALASQIEARWQAAIGRLWLVDQDLTNRLRRRLVGAIQFEDNVIAPVWAPDERDTRQILLDLLNPKLIDAECADRTRLWLDTQPAAATWVIDDAGIVDAPTGKPVTMIGVANLSTEPMLTWVVPVVYGVGADMQTVPPLSTITLTSTAPQDKAAGPFIATDMRIVVGDDSFSQTVVAKPLPAAPPGVRIGPFVREWSLADWIEGRTVPITGPGATAALIHKIPSAGGDSAQGERPRWALYIECGDPDRQQDQVGRQETLRVWFGRTGAARSVVRIESNGVVVDELALDKGLGGAGGSGGVQGARVVREAGRWIAFVPIPSQCIEADGTLRIGMERIDRQARRSSWPRPMFPWQTEPGRIAIDTKAWKDPRDQQP